MTSRTTTSKMTLCKMVLLAIGLSAISALVACSSNSSSSTPPTPTVAISATAGTPQGATVGAAFSTQLQATVTSNGSPASGVAVTFTAPPSGASGTFATSPAAATDTETTNSSGIATSQVFTANTTAGSYAVTASATGASTPASFSLTNNAGAAATITVVTGTTPQTATISAAFPTALAVSVTDSNSNPVAGTSITFAAPTSGPSGTFATTPASTTATVTTGTDGTATAPAFTANSAIGTYTVTASSGTLTAANFSLTNAAPVLATGNNYVFSLAGTDQNGTYFLAGAFTANSGGTLTGEMDFSDYSYFVSAEQITGSISPSANTSDTNFTITISFPATDGETYINGGSPLTFDANLVSSSRALLTELDGWATSSGDLNLQTIPASSCSTVPTTPCGFAFFTAGVDSADDPIAIGGVISIDSAGGISGTGSVFDANDEGNLFPSQSLTASTVSVTPDPFGLVTLTLYSSTFGSGQGSGNPCPSNGCVILDGYMVDASHIRLIENWYSDTVGASTGGTAFGQTGTGTFSSTSISGNSYVIGVAGSDTFSGPHQMASQLTFDSDGSIVGNLSFNEIALQSPQGGVTLAPESTTTPCSSGTATTACYAVDASGTGRVTLSNVTDGATILYNLQLYLTGDANGDVVVISMDNGNSPDQFEDVLAGRGVLQDAPTASFNGSYSADLGQVVGGAEQDGVGAVTASAGTLTGFFDVNEAFLNPVSYQALSGNFAASSTAGVLTGTTTDPDTNTDVFTYYVVDGNSVVGIENDANQLTLGLFELQ
jgi:hypothetical protein